MPSKLNSTQLDARERILDSAYQLFTRNGVTGTGINEVLTHSGAAKATLYRAYESKTELALAAVERRGLLWSRDWLELEVQQQSAEARKQLLAIFDVLETWFRTKDYEGCLFIRLLHESNVEDELREAAIDQLTLVRAWIQRLATKAGLAEPKQFAIIWHALMNGAIVAANAGQKRGGAEAKRAALLVLKGWPAQSKPRQNGSNRQK